MRINEALTLHGEDVCFENLLVKVRGKGDKERVIPFSLELRKILHRFMTSHKSDLVFPASDGYLWQYRALDQFKDGCRELGIEGGRLARNAASQRQKRPPDAFQQSDER